MYVEYTENMLEMKYVEFLGHNSTYKASVIYQLFKNTSNVQSLPKSTVLGLEEIL